MQKKQTVLCLIAEKPFLANNSPDLIFIQIKIVENVFVRFRIAVNKSFQLLYAFCTCIVFLLRTAL